jgi:3-oxoadipate enol-lactonase
VEESVRDLVRETNLIALKTETCELGDERLPKTPAVNRLGEIQVPTLVIVGDQDRPEIIEAADFLERSITHARNVVIPKTAHLSSMEKPAEFNRIVLEFLEGLRL